MIKLYELILVFNVLLPSRSPRFWLVFQMLLFIAVGGFINGWHVQYWPGSRSYITVSMMSLREGLGAMRTLGYPLLLRVAAFFSNDYSTVVICHF